MEEDHDFSEFEDVKAVYRRSLLPWWLWVILSLYITFRTALLISEGISLARGYVFAFDIMRINVLIPYPYYPVISALLCIFMGITVIMLWLEKKQAAFIALWCFGFMLALCTAILVKGLLTGHFYFRVEMVIFIDVLLRLSDNRNGWEHEAISRSKLPD